MIEGIPQNTPEKDNEKAKEDTVSKTPTPEEMEWLKDYLDMHPETKSASIEAGEVKEKFEEFLDLVSTFESKNALEELNEITDLTPELSDLFTNAYDMSDSDIEVSLSKLTEKDRDIYLKRSAAKKELIPIRTLYDTLIDSETMSQENKDVMKTQWKRINAVVGLLHKGKIEHRP
jgi:Mg2+ and Co2+ transporter CorA